MLLAVRGISIDGTRNAAADPSAGPGPGTATMISGGAAAEPGPGAAPSGPRDDPRARRDDPPGPRSAALDGTRSAPGTPPPPGVPGEGRP